MDESATEAILIRVEKKVDDLSAIVMDIRLDMAGMSKDFKTLDRQSEDEKRSRKAGDAVLHGKVDCIDKRLLIVEGRPADTTHRTAKFIGKGLITAAIATLFSLLTWLFTRNAGG